MTRTCAAVVKRFRELGVELPDVNWELRRVRAGHWQRAAGAWSWYLWNQNDRVYSLRCGSQWPASAIAAKPQNFKLYYQELHNDYDLYEDLKQA